MKLFTFLFINIICFFSCSDRTDISEGSNTSEQTISVSKNSNNDFQENLVLRTNETPIVDARKPRTVGNFRVDIYEDNKLFCRSFFRNGLLIKDIGYNTQTKKPESVVKFFYKKNGEYDRIEVSGADWMKEMIPEIDKSNQDFLVQYEFLKSKNIEFPLPNIVTGEVTDLSNIFSVADNYNDFKTESRTDGTQKFIRLIGFNKKIRFHHSTIAFLIGNDSILIKDYELTLENNFPSKELYKTDAGDLTKTYSYKDRKLISVVYQFTDVENQTNYLTKRFDYHDLR